MSIAWPWDTPVDGQPWTGPGIDEMTAYVRQQGAGQAVLDAAVLALVAPDALHDDTADVPNTGTGGSALDASPNEGRVCITRGDDPATFAVHPSTNVVESFTTPHAAGLVPGSEGVFIGAQWRAIGDAEAGGTEDGNEVVGKIRSLNTGVTGYDEVDWSLWFGLAAPFAVGQVGIIWTDTSDEQQSVSREIGSTDPYTLRAVGAWLLPDNGNDQHEVTFYTWDGSAWQQEGTTVTVEGTTSIRDVEGPLTAMSMSTLGGWAEVRDGGPAGDLMARFDPAEATAPLGPGGTWEASTGETWTAGSGSAIFDRPAAPTPLLGQQSSYQVAATEATDPGTADWTLAFDITVPAIAAVDGQVSIFAQRADGIPGQGGTGWALYDLRIDAFGLDGAGAISSDGSDTAAAISNTGWTVGRHVVVVTMDRDGNQTTYVDGTARGTAAMADVGDLGATAGLQLGVTSGGYMPCLFHAHAQWDRLLDADEIAAVTARIGHP